MAARPSAPAAAAAPFELAGSIAGRLTESGAAADAQRRLESTARTSCCRPGPAGVARWWPSNLLVLILLAAARCRA
jgi:hypothetical protein